jgi:hypothetical protein
MIFNSDDGFLVSETHGAGDSRGSTLGVFNGGRGASDTTFGFAVAEPGVYPIRAIWYEGGGGANLEWSSIVDGERVLINDTSAGGLKAYRSRSGTPTNVVTGLADGAVVAINFAADEPAGNRSDVTGAAGVLGTVNWNNVDSAAGSASDLVADVAGASTPSGVSVEWASPNTWSSTGRGEENNTGSGNDGNLMTGYIDTNAEDPISATVSGLPDGATYDVIVYIKGGVNGKGGDYTIGDQVLSHTDTAAFDGNFVYGEFGDYLVFKGVTGSSFTLQSQPTHGGGSAPRAPINGLEVVIGGGVEVPGGGGGDGSISSVALSDGSVVIEYTGTLKSATSVTGPYSPVAGASSPYSVAPTQAAEFYIAE